MMPTAHEVAVAIVTAARECGAHPEQVLLGGANTAAGWPISRARWYAAKALDRVFNRPTIEISTTQIARMVGVSPKSVNSYFASNTGRPTPWFNDEIFKRVVDAVMDAEPSSGGGIASVPPPTFTASPVYTPPPGVRHLKIEIRHPGTSGGGSVSHEPARERTADRPPSGRSLTAPARGEPIKPGKASHGPPRTGLDRFAERFPGRDFSAGGSVQIENRAKEQRECRDLLAEAAANTARLQAKLPPEPEPEQ